MKLEEKRTSSQTSNPSKSSIASSSVYIRDDEPILITTGQDDNTETTINITE